MLGLAACAPTVTLGGDSKSHQPSWAFWLFFSNLPLSSLCVLPPPQMYTLCPCFCSFFLSVCFPRSQCISMLRFCLGHRTYFSYILCLFYSGLLNFLKSRFTFPNFCSPFFKIKVNGIEIINKDHSFIAVDPSLHRVRKIAQN